MLLSLFLSWFVDFESTTYCGKELQMVLCLTNSRLK